MFNFLFILSHSHLLLEWLEEEDKEGEKVVRGWGRGMIREEVEGKKIEGMVWQGEEGEVHLKVFKVFFEHNCFRAYIIHWYKAKLNLIWLSFNLAVQPIFSSFQKYFERLLHLVPRVWGEFSTNGLIHSRNYLYVCAKCLLFFSTRSRVIYCLTGYRKINICIYIGQFYSGLDPQFGSILFTSCK